MDRSQIAALIDESLRAAEASDFALIRRIPSSSKFDFIDHYLSLDPIEKGSLRQSIGIRAAAWFGFPINREEESDLLDAFTKYRARVGWIAPGDLKRSSYRMLSAMRGILNQEPDHQIIKNASPEELKRIMTVSTAKATELRKVAKSAFGGLLGAKPANRGGGVWIYEGQLAGEEVGVELDFGHSGYTQLRYQVRIAKLAFCQPNNKPAYESLHGFGTGCWDQIEEGDEERSFAVLGELVQAVVEISSKIYSGRSPS